MTQKSTTLSRPPYSETYQQRFRTLKPREEESPRELMTRLQDLASRWTRETSSHQELLDLLVREQFLSVLPPDVKIVVMERQPKDCSEASQFAENYLQARAASISPRSTSHSKVPSANCPKCGRHGHWARECPHPRTAEVTQQRATPQDRGTSQRSGQPQSGTRDTRTPLTNIQMVKCFH